MEMIVSSARSEISTLFSGVADSAQKAAATSRWMSGSSERAMSTRGSSIPSFTTTIRLAGEMQIPRRHASA
ncbi:hypothetical protein DVH05_003541 [Phytophthora capsici]|nr:hypothetical protein DVH05_003541 [Phytophthora capsici]